MPRLILFLALLTALVLAAGFAMRALSRLTELARSPGQEIAMPDRFSKIAYVLLIIMLFTVTSGAL